MSLHLRIWSAQIENQAPTEGLLEDQVAKFGYTYRIQHRIGSWFADLAWPGHMVIAEADDSSHTTPERRRKDAVRDAWMQSHGWTVLRFTNAEVQSCPQAVAAKIKAVLDAKEYNPHWRSLKKAQRDAIKADIAARKAQAALKRVAKAHAAANKVTKRRTS